MSGIEFRKARRENEPLVIGLAGYTGSGKTFSGMRLAAGMAGGKPFAVIDTENGRANHYADDFDFHTTDLRAPFRPERYTEAIEAAVAQGYSVILVDSMSHEYAGDGGLLDWAEDELTRMAGDDWKKREALSAAGWIKPKRAHKKMMSRMLQVPSHLILCFRAEEKIEFVKEPGADGKLKTVVRPKRTLTGGSLDGWIPITEKTVPYELTASFLLSPSDPGVPRPIKLEDKHRPFFPLDKPVSEEAGAALAAWAAGGQPAAPVPDPSDAVTSSEGRAATSAPGAAEISEEEELLAKTLLTIADSVGNRDVTVKAIEKNRSDPAHSQADRVAWLRKQLERAQAVVA
jgi:hypothetical protein